MLKIIKNFLYSLQKYASNLHIAVTIFSIVITNYIVKMLVRIKTNKKTGEKRGEEQIYAKTERFNTRLINHRD